MILVAVGTERPFDRLVRAMDRLCRDGLTRDVLMQIGAEGKPPRHAAFERFFSFDQLKGLMRDASLVVCHAGPGLISLANDCGKKPLVVPRRPEFGEVVDNHQVLFARRLGGTGRFSVVEDPGELATAISLVLSKGDNLVPIGTHRPDSETVRRFDALVCAVMARRGRGRRLWDRARE